MERLLSLSVFLGLGMTMGAVSVACNESGEAKFCEVCAGSFAYACNVQSTNNIICAVNDAHAIAICPEGWSISYDCRDYSAGSDSGESDTSDPWSPADYVYFDTTEGLYIIESSLIERLAIDSSILLRRDYARLTELQDVFFQLESIAPNDLADMLGLKNGDIIYQINDYPLETWDNYITALIELRHVKSLTLIIWRSDELITLNYQIK